MPIIACHIGSDRQYQGTGFSGPYTFELDVTQGKTLRSEDAEMREAKSRDYLQEKGLI
jgi:hypothetical protein